MTGPVKTGQAQSAAGPSVSWPARLMLAVLVADAVLLAVLELLYLPLRLPPRYGGATLPLSIMLAAVSTPLLVHAASRIAPRLAVAGAPLGAWVLSVLVFGVAGPGGDVLLPADFRSLLLLVAGVLPSGVVLGRVSAERAASGPAAVTGATGRALEGSDGA